jgi:hypothetical protein
MIGLFISFVLYAITPFRSSGGDSKGGMPMMQQHATHLQRRSVEAWSHCTTYGKEFDKVIGQLMYIDSNGRQLVTVVSQRT